MRFNLCIRVLNLPGEKWVGRSPYLISSSLMQSVERILAVFDDGVQFGLVNLRLNEIKMLDIYK